MTFAGRSRLWGSPPPKDAVLRCVLQDNPVKIWRQLAKFTTVNLIRCAPIETANRSRNTQCPKCLHRYSIWTTIAAIDALLSAGAVAGHSHICDWSTTTSRCNLELGSLPPKISSSSTVPNHPPSDSTNPRSRNPGRDPEVCA